MPGPPEAPAAEPRPDPDPRPIPARDQTPTCDQPLTRWRMELAAAMLRDEPGRTLAEVATAVGYSDEFAFAAAFRREVGTPPGAYRTAGPPPAHRRPAPPARHPASPHPRRRGGEL
ncbi:helix-turn-helix domain-containing protein [Dactylosporangium aurantiacum]|uniref:helix-turn-helix domain-containing protein n=1 Tax=Dactylosporangium aurantiacum TaxID=35754 RepID=UPI003CCBDE31